MAEEELTQEQEEAQIDQALNGVETLRTHELINSNFVVNLMS